LAFTSVSAVCREVSRIEMAFSARCRRSVGSFDDVAADADVARPPVTTAATATGAKSLVMVTGDSSKVDEEKGKDELSAIHSENVRVV
jgi:hypothetical protein